MGGSAVKRSWKETLVNILVPLLGTISVVFNIFVNGEILFKDMVITVAFILCFDFIMLFYIDNRRSIIYKGGYSIFLISVTPAICLYCVHIAGEGITSVIILIFAGMLSGLVDFGLSMINLFGVCIYSAFFMQDKLGILIPYLLLAFLLCILTNRVSKKDYLIASCFVMTVFYAIILIIHSTFILENVFSVTRLVILIIALFVLVLVYLLNKSVSEAESPASPAADTQKDELISEYEKKIAELGEKKEELERKLEKKQEKESSELQTAVPAPAETFSYEKDLEVQSPKLFQHCVEVMNISKEAAELIGCDTGLTSEIAIVHEASRFLGDDYAKKLSEKYLYHNYVIKSVDMIKDKTNSNPMSREAGIVLLTDDIINTLTYLRSKNKDDISAERIVLNTFKVRKDQNFLRLAGFTNEEVQLLKLFYTDKCG